VVEVPLTFNARTDAFEREYVYRIVAPMMKYSKWSHRSSMMSHMYHANDDAWVLDDPFDLNAVRVGSKYLIGDHDFKAFQHSACTSASSRRIIKSITVKEQYSIRNESDGLEIFTSMMVSSVNTFLILDPPLF
jgi:tRNA pseudouridine(38-40) synthase